MTLRLDAEEQEFLQSFESGEWVSAPDRDEILERHRRAASATVRKDRRLNIRISGRDLEALQRRALEEGIPYQTLIASVLHKFVTGRLRERRG